MQSRHFAVSLLVLAVVAWAAPPASGQSADSWEPPRTPEGRPDLQGVWLNNVATPLERLPELADRSHLTREEVATLTARADRIFANGRSAFTTPEGAFRAALQNVETYIAWSTSSSIGMVDVTFTDRTSLIVDPPDGRIPALTPAARARVAAVDRGWEFKTGPDDLNSIHRCITTGVPRLGGNFGAGPYTFYQIVQTSTHLAFISEAFHDARIIPIGTSRTCRKRSASGTATPAAAGRATPSSWRRPTSRARAITAAPPTACIWWSASPAPDRTRWPIASP